jgi:hypothetical protein
MRSKWFLPSAVAVAIALLAVPASAQTISYINLLQFDLVSYRSQATAGMFDDDIENVANAARLLEIDGNRLYTNFSNLHDPATMGDDLISYSSDALGFNDGSNIFDDGSYLAGWTGRYDRDSQYVFSLFYQRNHWRQMFEDLDEDHNIGFDSGEQHDAEYTNTIVTEFDDGTGFTGEDDNDGVADRRTTEVVDLMRYDDNSRSDIDFGVAREVSSDLSIGGRFFWEKDVQDRFAEGRVETINESRQFSDGAVGSPLRITDRQVTTYMGPGEEAFKHQNIGVSFNADYHAWSDQSVNVRFDVFGTNMTNPSMNLDLPSRGYDPLGVDVNFSEFTDYTVVTAGDGTGDGQFNSNADLGAGGLGYLDQNRENRDIQVRSFDLTPPGFPFPYYSVDDERTGIAIGALVSYDRVCAGGDLRTWGGYRRTPYDIDATVVRKFYDRETFWWNAGSGDQEAILTNTEATLTETRDGDMTLSAWELGTRWTRDVNQNVAVGWGLIVSRNTWNEDYSNSMERVEWSGFSDGVAGDNVAYDADIAAGGTGTVGGLSLNERSTVTTTIDKHNIEDEYRTTTARLPVGLRLKWGEGGRYRWNMGLTHNINNSTRETTLTVPADGAGRPVTVVNDVVGAIVDEITYGDPAVTENSEIIDKMRWNTTTYFYGFEVMITDAVQANVNGIFDTYADDDDDHEIFDVDFWRELAISLTFAFM